MKTFTIQYETKQQLDRFCEENQLCSYENLLVQVFTSQNNKSFISSLQKNIIANTKNGKIIGTTTCGEISNDGALTNSTIISFTAFDNTKIQTTIMQSSGDSFDDGVFVTKQFDNDDSNFKLMITFTDGLVTNGEEYLAGISSINPKLVITGGMAGDNSKFEQTLVFDNKDIYSNGAVAAGLYNKDLNIYTDYSFNWESVGKKHTVEKSVKNRVYRLNGMTPVEFYKHYLGESIEKLLPSIGIEFPWVIKLDGLNVARAVLAKHDDGSLSFAGNIPEGSQIQFGHGDVQMIINKGLESVKGIIEQPVESIFIYSCMARLGLMKDDINLELLPLREIAPISGFFTYGEFYHGSNLKDDKNQLLNQTMTILAISESKKQMDKITPNIFSHNPPNVNDLSLHRTQALSTLIERTTKELEELNLSLEERVKIEVEKNIEKDNMMYMMQTQSQLSDMLEMILHQWRQPLSGITTATTSMQMSKMLDTLDEKMMDDMFDKILKYTENLNTTIDDFRQFFHGGAEFKHIDTSKFLDQSLTIVSALVKKYEINIIREYVSHERINIPISLTMQVIVNILKNAIDALIERNIKEKEIKLNIKFTQKHCIITISDNAGGIPEDILPKIFDKKFTTKHNTNGTGIGLDMSKRIIEEKVHGSIKAFNKDGCAVFEVSIPHTK